MWTRRRLLTAAAALPAIPRRLQAAPWTKEWDTAVLAGSLDSLDDAYDEAERMVTQRLGPEYRYHTNLRSTVAHPTRTSLEYALYLLEAGRRERAFEVLDRVLALQVTDPASKWYGLWGWYMEEPPDQMSPADWNWADFNGGTLLLVERRHGGALPEELHSRVREAIRHAAYSVRRRNVGMGYTNIAVKGTFVTLAAAELLGLQDLREYAQARMYFLARHIDETGSFTEYNSPTYARVTIANLTRMRMLFRSMEMREMAAAIHERAWMHLAKHWHAPTRQLAGPMSRSYGNDIGAPLWLQKALGGRLEFATLAEVRNGEVRESAETAVLDFECPDQFAEDFPRLRETRLHREIFRLAEPPEPPLQGTTYLAQELSLGSANKSDFWVQRRPLLAYWGGGERPARCFQLRLMKDDYDFSSGLFYSVQEQNCVLGFLNFRSPGGDKHISLDPVKDGVFECSRLRWRADIAGAPAEPDLIVDGRPGALGSELPAGSRIAVDLGGAYLWMRFPRAVFGSGEPSLTLAREEGLLTISLDLHRSANPEAVSWARVNTAWAALALVMAPAEGALTAFSRRCAEGRFEHRETEQGVRVIWHSPAGRLWLQAGSTVAPVSAQDGAYRAGIRSAPVPYVRLSDKRLAP